MTRRVAAAALAEPVHTALPLAMRVWVAALFM
jgi:hypothetical protein